MKKLGATSLVRNAIGAKRHRCETILVRNVIGAKRHRCETILVRILDGCPISVNDKYPINILN